MSFIEELKRRNVVKVGIAYLVASWLLLQLTEVLTELLELSTEIGKIAKPRKVWIVTDMPKTRSGKIMRRVLGAISNDKDVGDVTTLANPDIVEEIKKMAKG